jgi:uridine kinase
MNIIGICGDSGSGKTTLAQILKSRFNDSFILECDRYHKWERNDPHWKNITHLNPEANNLDKMFYDILTLKYGKSINQSDYDHSTGKFTEKQLIVPPQTLIVCGLHSAYYPNLYNTIVYVDTDYEIKKKWKIKRDVEERGYKLDEVVASIEKRREDYIKYVLPQREATDYVIKFEDTNG